MPKTFGWMIYLDEWVIFLIRKRERLAQQFPSSITSFLINCWGMRGFRSLLASLHCAQRNNHIRFRKANDWKGRETGTVPTDVLPREAGNVLCCGKWDAEVSQSAWQVCSSLGTGRNRDGGLFCHSSHCPVLLMSFPEPPPCLVSMGHLHCRMMRCGNEGREIKVESGWWQRSWEPWAYHSARQALVVLGEPRRREKWLGNEPPAETERQQTLWTGR